MKWIQFQCEKCKNTEDSPDMYAGCSKCGNNVWLTQILV